MTTVVSQILKQTRLLSVEEQLELANKLMEQARQLTGTASLLRIVGEDDDEAKRTLIFPA
jgi:hypothetical protein